MNPIVSVIVPCYKQAQFLPDTLDSVLAQTYPHWECIIVNDGSPDNTEEIAKQYCNQDSRFKYVYKSNGGLSSARNAGLKEIKGDYIQFLDSDDMIDATKFEKQVKCLKNSNCDLSISNVCFLNSDGKIAYTQAAGWDNKISSNFRFDILQRWDKKFSIPIHSPLIKAKLIKDIRFDEILRAKEDWLFWVDVSSRMPIVEYMDDPLAIYRVNDNGMTSNRILMQQNSIRALIIISSRLLDVEKDDFLRRSSLDVWEIFEFNSQIERCLNDELTSIKSSNAYKVGKILLKPFKVIKRLFI